MRKILFLTLGLLLILVSTVFAADFQPTKKVVLFYRVADTILQVQNSDEDMIAGKEELETELRKHYSKRFIVEGIQRNTYKISPPSFYKSLIKPDQIPFMIVIEIAGGGLSIDHYQNIFGAPATGYAPSVKVHLNEAVPTKDGSGFAPFDYGIKNYTAGTFSVGNTIFATEKDPRKNVKNAVRASFRDACVLNSDKLNKYINPVGVEYEIARYNGDFEKCGELYRKQNAGAIEKVNKFKAWCNEDETRKTYLVPLNNFPNVEAQAAYIEQLEKMGMYKEK